jgi:flagellar motor switch protein FliM
MQLSLGGVSGPLAVEVAWEELRPRLGAMVSQPGGVAAEALQEAQVAVEVMFPPQSLTAAELLGLQPGDVIRLGAANRPVWLRVGSKWIGRGRAGAQGKQLAVSVTGLHSKEESDASER